MKRYANLMAKFLAETLVEIKKALKMFFSHEKKFKFLTTVLKTFGFWPYEPSMAVAVAKGAKPSATAIEIRPSAI